MISFWNRLVNNNERMSSCIYRLLYSLKSNGIQSFNWLNCIESIFNDVGLSYIFENQIGFIDVKYITQILHDQFIQKWFSDIENSSRGEFYSLFKKNFGLENYLLKLPVQNRIWMTKLRTCNLRIPIETGRWANIPRQERTCTFCNDNVGNEFHVFFMCNNDRIVNLRNIYLPNYYVQYPNITKMSGLLSLYNVQLNTNVLLYLSKK